MKIIVFISLYSNVAKFKYIISIYLFKFQGFWSFDHEYILMHPLFYWSFRVRQYTYNGLETKDFGSSLSLK